MSLVLVSFCLVRTKPLKSVGKEADSCWIWHYKQLTSVCVCVFSGLFVQFSLPADWFRDQWRICQTAEWNCGKVSAGRQNQGDNNTERAHTHTHIYAISREYTCILWGEALWRVSCSVGSTHWCAPARNSSSEHGCSHHEQCVWVLHGAKWASQVRKHWTHIISERSVCMWWQWLMLCGWSRDRQVLVVL